MAENLVSSTPSGEPAAVTPSVGRHLSVGLMFIVPMLFVAVMSGQQGSTPTATAAAVAAPGAAAEPAQPPAAGAASAPGSQGLRSELQDLSAQLKTIRGLVDGLPKPEPAADLKPIEAKIDEVSRSIAVAKPLLEKVEKLGGRIGDIGTKIDGLKEDVVALKTRKPK